MDSSTLVAFCVPEDQRNLAMKPGPEMTPSAGVASPRTSQKGGWSQVLTQRLQVAVKHIYGP